MTGSILSKALLGSAQAGASAGLARLAGSLLPLSVRFLQRLAHLPTQSMPKTRIEEHLALTVPLLGGLLRM